MDQGKPRASSDLRDDAESPAPRGTLESREPLLRLPAAAMIVATLVAGVLAASAAAFLTHRIVERKAATAAAAPQSAAPEGVATNAAGAEGGANTDPGSSAKSTTTPSRAADQADPVVSSLLGSAVAVIVTIGGILVLSPWRTRPAGTWAMLWLAGTVGRLLVTPLVGLAVYSATPVGLEPFLLSLAGSYLACLAAEVAVSARGIARALAAGDASAGGGSSAFSR
ncbi:MAG: hypothetical protein FJ253_01460 [Phycisphaerae bacterium]|nr:hypothetical protein [Phycisphaerae bacterium]